MIAINNMSFAYKSKTVFNGLDLQIAKGGIYGLLGLNGSGKSTLLYLMCGLLRPKMGEIMVKNTNVALRRPSVLSDIYIVPEEFELPALTLRKYVSINSKFYPNFSMNILEKSLNAFNMDMDMNFATSSMGQRKKAFLCFAMATNTSLLLMDEPTNGLDIPSKSMFRKAVAECMTDERTIIISTHQVRDIENMLDRILIIDDSRLLLDASMSQIASKLTMQPIRERVASSDALFSMQIGLESYEVLPNEGTHEETPINIEMLFNAVLANKERIHEIFNN